MQILESYRRRDMVEKSFDRLKNDLGMKAVSQRGKSRWEGLFGVYCIDRPVEYDGKTKTAVAAE